jgi:hypothetical protein
MRPLVIPLVKGPLAELSAVPSRAGTARRFVSDGVLATSRPADIEAGFTTSEP